MSTIPDKTTLVKDGLVKHSRSKTVDPRPPEIKGRPIMGVLREFRKNPPAFLEKAARDHGDIVRFRLGPQKAYLLNHPDSIKDVLVTNQANFTKSRMLERARVLLGDGLLTSEGDFHRRQRRLVQPAFHHDRLAGYAASMVDCAARCRAQWQPGTEFDLSQSMMRLSMAIVARALFSADIESEADDISGALGQVFELFEALLMPFSQWLEKLPLPSVSVVLAGGLPLDNAQVVLESISVAKREVNTGGLTFVAGEPETDADPGARFPARRHVPGIRPSLPPLHRSGL